jgi:hypothetical protein
MLPVSHQVYFNPHAKGACRSGYGVEGYTRIVGVQKPQKLPAILILNAHSEHKGIV